VVRHSLGAILRWPSLGWLVAAVSLSLGAVVLVLGLTFEGQPWVQDRPFLTNVVSGLCGALFGIPFALFVVQRIARTQAEQVQRKAAHKIARWAADQLVDAVRRLAAFTDSTDLLPAISHIGVVARRIEEIREVWRGRFSEAISQAAMVYGHMDHPGPDLVALQPDLDKAAAEARSLLAALDTVSAELHRLIGDNATRRYLASEVAASWGRRPSTARPGRAARARSQRSTGNG
jgi:hypothetical protein